jgi:hypothetical protein
MHIRGLGSRSLGRQFGWLWAAYAVSAYGSGIGFGAFPLIAVRVLHSGPVQVSALSASARWWRSRSAPGWSSGASDP